MRVIDAISDGLRHSMLRHDDLVLMGQDIADYGGVFKITDGFLAEFGADRVRNTPLCESAIVGIGLGLSLEGIKSMVEMQFADFVTCGFNQIINNLAKLHYRWGASADVVVRMPAGGGMSAGPYHSQSNEAWFFKTPGLKIAYPSNPIDAKGLLISAIDDPNPVLFFEHKFLYRSVKDDVPTEAYAIPFGQAAIPKSGDACTIVTYGAAVQWAIEALDELGVHGEVIDLRTLVPLDMDTVEASVRKTHRALLLHEDTMTGGVGAEIAARLGETLFNHLDAPIMRVASLDTPVPFAKNLEDIFMGKARLKETITKLINY
ncbi:UNVERIFIED_CONTAM: hypothetical protein GTU68_049459 [Idotea baltica]|nr:hypothetical protein [Idotea baltica]